MAMERIFSGAGAPSNEFNDDDDYSAMVRAMITDSVDYNESELAPDREENIKYYYGELPSLAEGGDTPEETYSSYDDTTEGPQIVNRSTVVSTDVRDTIMTIMPSLMRIFAGSEHSVNFFPNSPEQSDMAAQATDYIRYKFWEENEGFLVLHAAIKDALQNKIGVIKWWSDEAIDVRTQTYRGVTIQQVQMLVSEGEGNSVVQFIRPPEGSDIVPEVMIRFQKSRPALKVAAVPLDEFRIDRRAKSVDSAELIGHEQTLRASDLIAMGYDPEVVAEHVGQTFPFSDERYYRNKGADTYSVFNDYVLYGEYYIRIDGDGDGVNEVRKICTMGSNYTIVDDEPANNVNYTVFGPDPIPHTLIGDSISDLVKDIQRIKTNLLRSSLDSLAQSIFPRTVYNELLVNAEDIMNDEVGANIRTRGSPNDSVAHTLTPFVGDQAFSMLTQMDLVRQSRTGISEASKGVDPKALQSTNMVGIDAIISGAQERIELIARILAETGMKRLYKGLLEEVTNSPNKQETVQLRGKWVNVDPSTFDPSMRCNVNPSLGKGSDVTRLQALVEIKNTQTAIISQFGINNPVCGVQEFRNTIVDMAAIANIKNVTRYFKEISPEVEQQIASAPKEPSPEELIAKAELEKVKKDVVVAKAKIDQDESNAIMDDDFRRDKLNVETMVDLVGILADAGSADVAEPATSQAQSLNRPG